MHHFLFSSWPCWAFSRADPRPAQDLALKRVMLSSGGLGYFEYEATVEGDATLSSPYRSSRSTTC